MAARAGARNKDRTKYGDAGPRAVPPPDEAAPGGTTHAPVDRVVETVLPRERRSLVDIVWWAAIVAAKAATIGFAVDNVRRADTPKLRGKGVRRRFFGYVGGIFIVPLAWRLSRHPGPYPRALDLAVSAPLLMDAGGNALGMYQEAHVDDIVHLANGAVVAGVASALLAPHFKEPWQAAVAGSAVSMAAATAWEIAEYGAWRLGADGLQLTYEDTMDDIIESWLGAIVGGVYALLRSRKAADRRSSGDRAPTGA